MIYLDYNATSLIHPAVVQTMTSILMESGNPSSIHALGRRARMQISQTREVLARFVNADPSCIFFTSGGTEANNLALRGVDRPYVLASAVDHASVRYAHLETEILPVDSEGLVQPEILDQALSKKKGSEVIVSVMMANNETGILQPLEKLVQIAHHHGALFHSDAIQAL